MTLCNGVAKALWLVGVRSNLPDFTCLGSFFTVTVRYLFKCFKSAFRSYLHRLGQERQHGYLNFQCAVPCARDSEKAKKSIMADLRILCFQNMYIFGKLNLQNQ